MNSKIIKKMLLVIAAVPMIGFSGLVAKNVKASGFDDVYSVAKSKLGDPYTYGAVGPNTFDCSGYTQYVYKKAIGVNLSRTAQSQYNTTQKVSASNLQKGDLVYFGGSKSSISHVGIYIGNGQMIDAQNRGVVIENINAAWWNKVGYSRPTNLNSSNSGSMNSNNVVSNDTSSVKYVAVNDQKEIKNSAKDNFYNHVLTDSKYSAKFKNYGSAYKGKTVTINMKATDANGNVYYRCYSNGTLLGWIKGSSLCSSISYQKVQRTMTVSNTPTSAFYNHVTDSKYSVKRVAAGASYAGKTVTVDMQATKFGWNTNYYRCSYNGKVIGWIYGASLN